MNTKILSVAALLILPLSSAAMAQTPAGGGSAEGNLNNPGSVKSNSEKAMERSTGSATGGAGSSTATMPGAASGAGTGTAAPTGGHSSGGGTSSGGMAR
ncbi:MAG: hypothetical protein K2Y56_25620 [Methylobacterium sp.]|uniref:hypothetical protein n=1 Tax=Methylobacterium sp. TaxID=409 RepID=UPI0025CD0CC8|nr:hypothetical protein [Methylobacterium sp.]MBX9934849.1 hypothetical protein [Methylobacterium sp.]